MARSFIMFLSACLAASLLVLSFHTWNNAIGLTSEFARPEVAVAGVRCLAVAAFALAQLIALLLVVDLIYPRRGGAWVVRVGVGLVGSISLVSGIALGLAGH